VKPTWVIVNPRAGGGQGARIISKLERALAARRIEFSLHTTDGPGHARELARAAQVHADRLLVVGGDGTIHEAASGLLSAAGPSATTTAGSRADDAGEDVRLPPLAVLPVGTGNDFFQMVRSPGKIEDAVEAVSEGVPRWFEVGEVRWGGEVRHFVNLLGVGIDVEVLRRRSAFARLPGRLQYLVALGSALTRYEPVPLKVTVRTGDTDPVILEGPVLLFAVTVGPSVGGGFVLSPNAVPDDGLLDLFYAGPVGLIRVVRYLPGILRGKGIRRPEIALRQGTQIHVERTDRIDLAFELDGELMESSAAALSIRVLPASLPVLEVPR